MQYKCTGLHTSSCGDQRGSDSPCPALLCLWLAYIVTDQTHNASYWTSPTNKTAWSQFQANRTGRPITFCQYWSNRNIWNSLKNSTASVTRGKQRRVSWIQRSSGVIFIVADCQTHSADHNRSKRSSVLIKMWVLVEWLDTCRCHFRWNVFYWGHFDFRGMVVRSDALSVFRNHLEVAPCSCWVGSLTWFPSKCKVNLFWMLVKRTGVSEHTAPTWTWDE